MMKVVCFFLLLLVFSCDDKTVKETEIYQIRTVGTLATSEYVVSKILKWNDLGEWYKYGDRKILISCKASIKAGIDLKKIQEKDIVVNGKQIQVFLPTPEIVFFSMDPNYVKTEMVEVNGFRTRFSQKDKSNILIAGEKSIRKDIQKLNILEDAEQNAKLFLTDYYHNLGFEEVIIHETPKNKRNTKIDY